MQNTDKNLIEEFKSTRDIEVLGKLYQPYLHLVFGVCLKYLKNRDDAKDAVSQIFELLIEDVLKYEISNFKSWLFVVCRNHCLMQLRQQKRLSEKMNIFLTEKNMESEMFIHPIDRIDNNDELKQQLIKCIEELKEQQKQCVRLFYYDKLCYAEIASQLKMELKEVKSFIQNGKRNLKICITRAKVTYEV